MKKDVLGVKIDDVNIDQALEVVKVWLSEPGPDSPRGEEHYIVTPNPEIIMMAQKDQQLKEILNKADLAIPDGVGLKLTTDIVCYTPGIDLMEELIRKSSDYGFTVGLLGGRPGVAEKAAERLMRKYPNLIISFVSDGGEIDNEGNSIEYDVWSIEGKKQKKTKSHYTLYSIPHTDILFVAFGPPKQEKWIAKNLPRIPVKVAMGVGGSLDVLSGRIPRAPKWIRKLGFEWLFRLFVEPWRIKRQTVLIEYLRLVMLS